ncbi:MAG: VTT domain-containing protein, partial [Aeromonas veronii]
HAFYAKHGGKTIIITRFLPIVRTFAPFVAGMGAMTYPRFLAFNLVGGLLWVLSFVYAGHFFGNLPVVRHNFTLLIFGIIGISLLPMVIGAVKAKMGPARA